VIDFTTRDRVRQLYATGRWSKTAIATMCGISRTSVRRIVDCEGKVNQPGAVQSPNTGQRCKPLAVTSPDMRRRTVRCPGCGGRVKLPCVRCQLVALGATKGDGRRVVGPLGLDLDNTNRTYPDHPDEDRTVYERYLEVKGGRTKID